jgi:hypothetical protein
MNFFSSLNNNNEFSDFRNSHHADNFQTAFHHGFSENLSSRFQNISMRFSGNLISNNPHSIFLPRSAHDIYSNIRNDVYLIL